VCATYFPASNPPTSILLVAIKFEEFRGGGEAEKVHAATAAQRVCIASRGAVLTVITAEASGSRSRFTTCFADGRAEILAVGETSHLFGVEWPRPRLAAVRLVDMTHRWIPVWIAMALALAGLRRQPVR